MKIKENDGNANSLLEEVDNKKDLKDCLLNTKDEDIAKEKNKQAAKQSRDTLLT